MIIWLNATLPLNAYYVDGIQTGDNYVYFWANKKAPKTYTDDEYYFVHRGKIDIFNFSKKPGAANDDLNTDFVVANKFKTVMRNTIANGTFIPLKSSNPEVFAYAMTYDNQTYLVFGNLNFSKSNSSSIKVPKYKGSEMTIPVKIKNIPVFENKSFTSKFDPGEVQVLLINEFTPSK